jgi:hypothetical protein
VVDYRILTLLVGATVVVTAAELVRRPPEPPIPQAPQPRVRTEAAPLEPKLVSNTIAG